VPAHFCGIHALKPTTNRLTRRGSFDESMFPGQTAIVGQAGPLGRSVYDLALAMNVLVAEDQLEDPSIPPVGWSRPDRVDSKGLRVGFYSDDGLFAAAPAVRRAVEEAAQAFRPRGRSRGVLSTGPRGGVWPVLRGAECGRRQMVEGVRGEGSDRRTRALILLARLPRLVRGIAGPASTVRPRTGHVRPLYR